MSFFIQDAWAEAAPAAAQEPGLLANGIMFAVFILVFYFMLWRPQSKRQKEQRDLMGNLSKGDEVVLAGGMLGRITRVVDDYVVVEVGTNMELRFQKSAVTATLPKGTIKSI